MWLVLSPKGVANVLFVGATVLNESVQSVLNRTGAQAGRSESLPVAAVP